MKKLLSIPCAYVGGLLIMVLLLVGACMIPNSAIADNVRSSAEYIVENENSFYDVERGGLLSYQRQDNYADMMLFNIAVSIEPSRPFASALEARYLLDPYRRSADLVLARLDGEATNADYSRYWHGMLIFIRPLSVIMTYPTMRIVNAVVLGGLFAWLCLLLIRRRVYHLALAVIFACAVTDFASAALCFEFYIMCMLSLLASCVALILDARRKREGGFIAEELHLLVLFTLVGTATCFFDFLTAETLTLLLPLLLVLNVRAWCERGIGKKKRRLFGISVERALKLSAACGIIWLICYALTYAVKWGLAAAICPDVTLADALGYASVRVNGEFEAANFAQPYEALLRNLLMLPILCLTNTDVSLWAVIGIFIAAMLVYLAACRRPFGELKLPALIFALGLLPYVRYMLLNNHSTLHHFFTYRAQAATIVATISALTLACEPDIYLPHESAGSVGGRKGDKR